MAKLGYAGGGTARVDDVARRDCVSCHMRPESARLGDVAESNGKVASHRFLGGHTWLAAMRGDRDQLRRIRAFLRDSASIDIAAIQSGQTGGFVPGEFVTIDVVVAIPVLDIASRGGVKDAQDVWIEIEAHDAKGNRIAASGHRHRRQIEVNAHVLRGFIVDDKGVVQDTRAIERFRVVAADQTVAPRDARVVHYRLMVPKDWSSTDGPIEVTARLLHRTRNLALQREVCRGFRSKRGKHFARAGRRYQKEVLDPCRPQPVSEIASVRVQARGTTVVRATNAAPAWQRWYEHGLGLGHEVQERLALARPSLLASWSALQSDGAVNKQAQGMVALALAQLAVRIGRLDEAQKWLAKIDASIGPAAVARVRGDAYAEVWRWREAARAYRASALLAPQSARAWQRLAVALASDRRATAAATLQAARAGLALTPRDPVLLRAQAVAARRDARVELAGKRAAMAAYDRYRGSDAISPLRLLCARRFPACARERLGVHVHDMEQ